jgi:pantoate--beta-alanine ligase
MITTKTIPQIKSEIKRHEGKKIAKRIAFVPTMGALHDGHLALVKKAQELADIVVVSIFVNKAQFNDLNDYKNYPRQDLEDLQKLEKCGVDLVFLPDEKEMLGDDFTKDSGLKITPSKLTNCLCGSARPGHFDGVALIVSKLFDIVKPDIAVFGQKDFQQLAIVKELIKNLNFNIEIFAHETFREKSGLAMSSRNQRLLEANKIKAAEIFRILLEIKNEVVKNSESVEEILEKKSQELLEIGFEKIDYLEIRTEDGLELVTKFDTKKSSRIFIAVYLGGVRLIDNLEL